MTEWSDDPMEVRWAALEWARRRNSFKSLKGLFKDALEVEKFVKEAKSPGVVLKMEKK